MTAIPPVSSVVAMPVRPVAPPSPAHAGFEALVDNPAAWGSDAGDESSSDMLQVGEGGDSAPAEAEEEDDGTVRQPASAAPDTRPPADLATPARFLPVRFNDITDDATDGGGVAIGQDRLTSGGEGPADDDLAASEAVMLSPGHALSVPARVQPIIEQTPSLDVAGVTERLRTQAPQPTADLQAAHGDRSGNEPNFAQALPEAGDAPSVYPSPQIPTDARTAPGTGSSREITDEPHAPAETGVAVLGRLPATSSEGIAPGPNLVVPARQRGASLTVDFEQTDVQPSVSNPQANGELVGITAPSDTHAQLANGQRKAKGGLPLRQAESFPGPATVQATSNDKPAADLTREGAADTSDLELGIAMRPVLDRAVEHAKAVAPKPEASGPAIRVATYHSAVPSGEVPEKFLVTQVAPRREGAEQAPPAGMAMPQSDERIADPPASVTPRADLMHMPQSPAGTRVASAPAAPEAHHAPRTPRAPGPMVEMRGGAAHATVLPDGLGRIDIRVERGDGGLSIFMRAERPESADLMRRNADILQRELAESGVGHARLEFSQGNAGNGGHGHGAAGAGAGQTGLMGGGGGAGNPAPHPRTATPQANFAAAQPAPTAADSAGRPRGASDRMDVRL